MLKFLKMNVGIFKLQMNVGQSMKTNLSLQYWKYTATIHCNGNRYSNMVSTAGVSLDLQTGNDWIDNKHCVNLRHL